MVRGFHVRLGDEIEVQRHAVAGHGRRVLHHRRAEVHVGIFPELFHDDGKRQAVNLQFAGLEQTLRDGRHLVAVLEDQFVIRRAFGIIFRITFGKADLHFPRQHVGRELADKQQNHARVCELDADFFGRQLKTVDVRANQIHQ